MNHTPDPKRPPTLHEDTRPTYEILRELDPRFGYTIEPTSEPDWLDNWKAQLIVVSVFVAGLYGLCMVFFHVVARKG